MFKDLTQLEKTSLLFQFIKLLFYLAQLFQHLVVVVLHHCINEDGVDERHADDAPEEHENGKIAAGKERQ